MVSRKSIRRKNNYYRADDSIELNISEDEEHNTVVFKIIINGKEVKHYSDFMAFMLFSKYPFESYMNCRWSVFEPFTCSCGASGCAGIWRAITPKHRRFTVEWRVPKESGYGFLDKPFYQFGTWQYEEQISKIWEWINDHREVEHERRPIGDWLDSWFEDEEFFPALEYLDSL